MKLKVFLQRAKEIHNDKYDYSLINEINHKNKLPIICKQHGVFYQQIYEHLRGNGCPCCVGRKKYTFDEFIDRLTQNNNNKYNYETLINKELYNTTKLELFCQKHNKFFQTTVKRHLNGDICPLCKQEIEERKQVFIKQANEKYSNHYQYHKINYIDNHSQINIVCPKHKSFTTTPEKHLQGDECPTCKKLATDKKLQFIQKSRILHGDKYDYSKVIYTNSKEKVTIICPIHDEFQQAPFKHLQNQGCPSCNKNKKLTNNEFIERSNIIHNNKYDYSKAQYVNNTTKVCIICPRHGEFWQTPKKHLLNQGCPKCGHIISKSEEEIAEFIKHNTNFEIIRNSRNIITPYELDIYIPEIKLAIEYNGDRWHSKEFGRGEDYHIMKSERCQELGIKLIHIFEHDYLKNKSYILHNIILQHLS